MVTNPTDPEAVLQLLEEKERKLELSSLVGKELWTRNMRLENTIMKLQNDLMEANDKIFQLAKLVTDKPRAGEGSQSHVEDIVSRFLAENEEREKSVKKASELLESSRRLTKFRPNTSKTEENKSNSLDELAHLEPTDDDYRALLKEMFLK